MRSLAGSGALVAALSFSLPASAEEVARAPQGAASPASVACDAHVVCRIAAAVLSKIVDAGRDEFGQTAERYAHAVDFEKRAEAPEAVQFDARFERYLRFQEFNQKLAAERAVRETQEFDAQVALVLRELDFMKRLAEKRQAAAGRLEETPSEDPGRDRLYRRP